ncbi:MAG: DUF4224 domain-containing protein [Burkholderiaceae bacterium]
MLGVPDAAFPPVALTDDELTMVTGYRRQREQERWLIAHRWAYVINGAGRIVVGRWYTDHRLAGVQPGEPVDPGGSVDLTRVR